MNVDAPEFTQYQAQFEALAETAQLVPECERYRLANAQLHLCLFGENGLSVAQEFDVLQQLKQASVCYKIEVDTAIWQDTVLFSEP